MVKLDEEYWHALSFCYERYGFKSRQDLVENMLRKFVDENCEMELERGVEKMRFLAAGAKVVGKLPATIPHVFIPSNSNAYSGTWIKMKFWFKDGRIVECDADGPLTALKMIEVDMSLTANDFDERVERYEFLEEVEKEDKLKFFREKFPDIEEMP